MWSCSSSESSWTHWTHFLEASSGNSSSQPTPWVHRLWSKSFDLTVKGEMRPIGSKIFAAKEASSLLVYNFSDFNFRESNSIVKTRVSVLVFHFRPKAFVTGCIPGSSLSNLIKLSDALSLSGIACITSGELLDHFCILKLKYPRHLFNLAVKQFVDSKVADQQQIPSTNTTPAPIRVVIPFKDQFSANIVKIGLTDLSLKIKTTVQPVFISRKLNEDIKFREVKPAIVNQQFNSIQFNFNSVQFQCNQCDPGYVGYTSGHLHERVDGHKQKSSSICRHYFSEHNLDVPPFLSEQFHVLTKGSNKFDCLIKERLFIRKLRPSLNVQADSIRVKVFI